MQSQAEKDWITMGGTDWMNDLTPQHPHNSHYMLGYQAGDTFSLLIEAEQSVCLTCSGTGVMSHQGELNWVCSTCNGEGSLIT